MDQKLITARIRDLISRAGMTLEQAAHAMGFARASSIQRYVTDGDYKKDFISADLATKLEGAICGKGSPPITRSEIWALAAPQVSSLVASFDPDGPQQPDFDPDWDNISGAGVIDGQLKYDARFDGGMPEVAATPGLGHGTIDDGRAAQLSTGGIATGHPVLNEWVIPSSYVRSALDASPGQIMIMPVIGHSMEPVLKSNDRVLVDISQNAWVGDAVYVIDDGDTVLRAKTIKKVTASNPPKYRIISEASPEDVETLGGDQFKIVGRVVGRFTKM